jgi:ribosome-dependent ATPase
VDASDLRTRLHIGYMSQLFSLYEELSVRQNLVLHARLYRMDPATATQAIEASLDTFELRPYAETMPASLSLGHTPAPATGRRLSAQARSADPG